MPRYDKTLSRRLLRAMKLADGDLEELFLRAEDNGLTDEAIERALIADLENDGPIFGRLKSNLMGAAEASVMAAQAQGTFVGEAIESGQLAASEYLQEMSDADFQAMMSGNDPDGMGRFEDATAYSLEYTWVSTLVNTCPFCLALHGKTVTRQEWRQAGLDPETIHAENSINAKCFCHLALATEANKDDLATTAPLKRTSLESGTGLKGNRRTLRAVTNEDPLKALEAVRKAQETEQGRRTLRMLGNAAPPEVALAVRDARAVAREEEAK